MNLKPLRGRYLIEPDRGETISPGGIICVEAVNPYPSMTCGKVIAVGDPPYEKKGKIGKMSAKTGDIIQYKRYSGKRVMIDEKLYLFVKEEDVLAVE